MKEFPNPFGFTTLEMVHGPSIRDFPLSFVEKRKDCGFTQQLKSRREIAFPRFCLLAAF